MAITIEERIQVQEKRAPNKGRDKVVYWALLGGILGIFSLISLDIPFLTESSSIWHFSDSFSGFFFLVLTSDSLFDLLYGSNYRIWITNYLGLTSVSLFDLLWLNVAGGITAAAIGLLITGRAMHGWEFSKASSSRKVAKLFVFSGMLVIAGSISALVQLLVIVVLQPHVFTIDFFVGWGAFAEMVIGLTISVVASIILKSIPN